MESGNSEWQYTGGEYTSGLSEVKNRDEKINWSASEYIAHEKTQSWQVLMLVGSFGVSALLYIIYSDILTAIAVLTAGSCATFLGIREPKAREYELSSIGLKVGARLYRFSEFKSFSIVEEGAVDSIWLKQFARFKPPVVLFFSPEDEKKILEVLSDYLPHEQKELDAIDRFSKRIRF